jgi:hypothetical protein
MLANYFENLFGNIWIISMVIWYLPVIRRMDQGTFTKFILLMWGSLFIYLLYLMIKIITSLINLCV